MEVARQCSNLAPSLRLAVSSHQAIRRRRGPATVTQEFAERLPVPVPRLTAEMLDEAEHRYGNGETLRQVAHESGREQAASHGSIARAWGRDPSPVSFAGAGAGDGPPL